MELNRDNQFSGDLDASPRQQFFFQCLASEHTEKKRFCYTNKNICSNRDNKNILLEQQNVWFYQQNVWLQQQRIYFLSLILLP